MGNRADKQHLLNNFRMRHHVFDQRYRLFKRRYERGQVLLLERIQTSYPSYPSLRLWSEINTFGPRRSNQIPMEIWGEDGHLVDDCVHEGTNDTNDTGSFDDQF